MRLLINNTLTGEQSIEEVAADILIVGRQPNYDDDAVDQKKIQLIELKSRFVSAQHLRLWREDKRWQVTNLTQSNVFKIADELVESGASSNVDLGVEIVVGEYSLILTEAKQDKAATELNVRAKFVELERAIHKKLLKWIELRRDEKLDLETVEAKEKILSFLDTILNDLLAEQPSEFVRGASKLAFSNRLMYILTAGEKTYGESYTKYLENKHEIISYDSALSKLEQRFLKVMDVESKPKTMEQDVEKLESQYDEVYARLELDFSRAMQTHLVREQVRHDVFDLVFGYGPLQDLLEMNSISEIMVVSKDQIFIEKFGVVEDSKRSFFNDDMLIAVIERIVQPLGRRVDKSSPMVDARLKDGSRVNAVVPPLAVKGPCLTIRKFSKTPLEMSDLIGFGAISERTARFLEACVMNHQNVIVSGGTGTGKTTMLNCLSRYIPHKERIVTIEDTAEVQLKQPHVVTLESRPANMEGTGAITIEDLVKNSLRMRPDRIVVGECRGAEALDMLQAMNTGHDGSMTTAHANSPVELILRIETMVLMGVDMPIKAIREQIVAAVDLIIQLTRLPDGRRCVTHISEVVGMNEETDEVIVEDIFRFHDNASDEDLFKHTGHMPLFIDTILRNSNAGLGSFF